jgi:hypothetical protein
MISIGTFSQRQTALPFAIGALTLAFAAATMASCAPIAFSIATVFLFAGPHNWIELRYFLSRLPSRFGQLKSFFLWSFGGLGLLMASYISMICAVNAGMLSDSIRDTMYAGWNSIFILWVVRLVIISGSRRSGRDWGWALPLGFLVMAGSWLSPASFWLALVYLHPFVGLWILDREIARSRPDWRKTYHLCLTVIPLLLALIWWLLSGSPSLPDSDALSWRITQHAGAGLLAGCSSHLLVSTHTFLEMIHYSVWLIAIPLISAGWQSWRPRSIPLTWRSPQWKNAVSAVLVFSSFAVVALWCAFAFNYSTTRDIYFTLALAHVLAEIPFLLKALM